MHCFEILSFETVVQYSIILIIIFVLFLQIGRSTESPIDFVVTDTIAGGQEGEETLITQSTISRFACRIVCERTPPYTARIYAAGFDTSKNIFLGVITTRCTIVIMHHLYLCYFLACKVTCLPFFFSFLVLLILEACNQIKKTTVSYALLRKKWNATHHVSLCHHPFSVLPVGKSCKMEKPWWSHGRLNNQWCAGNAP